MRGEYLLRQSPAQFGQMIEFSVERSGPGGRGSQLDDEIADLRRELKDAR